MCVCGCGQASDYHSQGNVICDLEEMELSLVDLLMLPIHSLCFSAALVSKGGEKTPHNVQFDCSEAKDKIYFTGNALAGRIALPCSAHSLNIEQFLKISSFKEAH